jgi:hypothetical protein
MSEMFPEPVIEPDDIEMVEAGDDPEALDTDDPEFGMDALEGDT